LCPHCVCPHHHHPPHPSTPPQVTPQTPLSTPKREPAFKGLAGLMVGRLAAGTANLPSMLLRVRRCSICYTERLQLQHTSEAPCPACAPPPPHPSPPPPYTGDSPNPTIATPKEEPAFKGLAGLMFGSWCGKSPLIATPKEPSSSAGATGVAVGDQVGGSNAMAAASTAHKSIVESVKVRLPVEHQ
jgi:hypothetical protein